MNSVKAAVDALADYDPEDDYLPEFAEVDYENLLKNFTLFVATVVTDTTFIDDLKKELELIEDNTIVLSSLEDFLSYTTAVPVDLEAVFEDNCQAHCYDNEILFLPELVIL